MKGGKFIVSTMLLLTAATSFCGMNHVVVGESCGLVKNNSGVWVSKALIVSDNSERTIFLQAGAGYNSPIGIITQKNVGPFAVALIKSITMAKNAKQNKKNVAPVSLGDFGNVNLCFQATNSGSNSKIIMTIGQRSMYMQVVNVQTLLDLIENVQSTTYWKQQ